MLRAPLAATTPDAECNETNDEHRGGNGTLRSHRRQSAAAAPVILLCARDAAQAVSGDDAAVRLRLRRRAGRCRTNTLQVRRRPRVAAGGSFLRTDIGRADVSTRRRGRQAEREGGESYRLLQEATHAETPGVCRNIASAVPRQWAGSACQTPQDLREGPSRRTFCLRSRVIAQLPRVRLERRRERATGRSGAYGPPVRDSTRGERPARPHCRSERARAPSVRGNR